MDDVNIKPGSVEPTENDSLMAVPHEHHRGDGEELKGPLVVGIGASAGGLNALRELFKEMPDNTGFSFVIVIHLAPGHESHFAELIQPQSKMPVRQISETTAIEPNNVYVIPPGANLDTIDTHLRLSDLEAQRHERAPIDHFFRTLAKTHGNHAVGIVLTGTGSDGTLGIRTIKEQGGMTIAQSPEEAEYDGMPRSAIASGMIDLVLALDDIPQAIVRFNGTRPKVAIPSEEEAAEEENNGVVQKILAQVRITTGQDFGFYKRSTIMRRIRRRMQLQHLEDLGAYLELLRGNSDEVRRLFDDMLITVTEFFRDEEVFNLLQSEVIPKLIAKKSARDTLRVWSIGCATGEEAYSLAILLLEESARADVHPQIQIFASDLHEASLKKAREGVYPDSIATEVSAARLQRYFIKEDGSYRIRKEVREMVVFAPHNMMKDPPFSHLDLIVCRNVLIYVQRDVQQDLIALFHYALEPEGVLILGMSESIDRSEFFMPIEKKCSAYQRRSVPTREPRMPIMSTGPRGMDRAEAPERPARALSYGNIHEKLIGQVALPSILVREDNEIVHISANAGLFLQVSPGEPTSNLFKLVREPLRIELRALLHSVKETNKGARSRPVHMQIDGGEQDVVLRVELSEKPDLKGFFLVVFEPYERAEAEAPRTGTSNASELELDTELQLTRQRLQTVIEDSETGREEMQAANEELQSTNEELRSTMEELETSKEELQSLNEELVTLNQENHHRVEELSMLSDDLQNLLTATEIAIIFLDRQLRIVRFTPKVGDIFNVRHSDRGRPLSDLTHRLGYPELQEDAQQVLERLVHLDREIEGDGKSFLVRMLPYRSSDDRILGVVISLFDITERKRAEQALKSEQHLRELVSELVSAEQRERKRLAALLHDNLQQLLAAAGMHLSMLDQKITDPSARELVQKSQNWVSQAITAARELTCELRPPTLYEDGLVPALHWLGDQMQDRHELRVEIAAEGAFSGLSDDMKALMFECARELLFNVVKHAQTEKASVKLQETEGCLRMVVSDQGRGIPSSAAVRVSEGGGGFGLFSIRERLIALGGSLQVLSTAGQGTAVEVKLPVKAFETAAAPHEVPVAPKPGEPATGAGAEHDHRVRVLVADDHTLVRSGISNIINNDERLTVVGEAADGDEAVDATERLRPDIVLIDLNMPRMNGIEATRQIRRRVPEATVIGISVQTDDATANSMLEAGAAAFIPKSADSKQMIAMIMKTAGRI